MRPVEIRPGFGHRRQPLHDPAGTLVVAALLVAIIICGLAAIGGLS